MDKTKINSKSVVNFLLNNAIIMILVLMVIYVGFTQNNFFSWNNVMNTASNVAVRLIVALGVSGCLITKGTDLSAGRIVGLGACIAATLLQKMDYSGKYLTWLHIELPILVVLLITVGVCCIFGLANGAIVSFLKVPPFIATLGMQTAVYGICMVYTKATPLGNFRQSFINVASGKLFGTIPYLFIYAFIIGSIIWFLYNKTRHGKYMYAIGGNENAAEVSGVNVNKAKMIIYTLAAALYAIAGFLLAAKSGGATVNYGQGYELEAIAACTIGGVSTNGGVGRVSGILIGVLVFELLKTSLQFLGVETNYTYIVQGVVIIIAVALDIRKYISKK
ncbi:MAG: beta-methylgalactoside transporter [Hungatella sp.]